MLSESKNCGRGFGSAEIVYLSPAHFRPPLEASLKIDMKPFSIISLMASFSDEKHTDALHDEILDDEDDARDEGKQSLPLGRGGFQVMRHHGAE